MTTLLRIDRPVRIARTADGWWGWTCWCCPPPLRWTTSYADTWRLAFEDADGHVRTVHPTTTTTKATSTTETSTSTEGVGCVSAHINGTEQPREMSCLVCGQVATLHPGLHHELYGHLPRISREDGREYEFDWHSYTFSLPVEDDDDRRGRQANVQLCTTEPHELGPNGTPLVDDPAVTAERAARLADELAALCDQLLGVLAWQDAVLALARPADDESAQCVGSARRINERAAASLLLVRDSLGEQHVICDELAAHLARVQPRTDVGEVARR